MNPGELYRRYQELQAYVGWSAADAARVQAVAALLQPVLPTLVHDFYAEIDRHPEAQRVITGGQSQIDRLKESLLGWLRELLVGPVRSRLRGPALASRHAARRNRPGSGLHQRRPVPNARRVWSRHSAIFGRGARMSWWRPSSR